MQIRGYYNDDNESRAQFDIDMYEAESKIKILRDKYSSVSKNVDKLSFFKLYMAMKEEKGIIPEIKVSHQNIFRVHCDYHNDCDMPFTIYDKMGYAICYGCGVNITIIDLIREYIMDDISKADVALGSIVGLAVEVADALINDVKYSLDEDGHINGYDVPWNYEFANGIDLVLYYVNKINKYLNSPTAQKYIDISNAMTEKHDERISNYINAHGIEITDKFANKLCLSKEYIKYRLYSHSLDEKLNMDRIIEIGKKRGRDNIFPFDSGVKEKLNIITFYENDDNVLNGDIELLTSAFKNLESKAKDLVWGDQQVIRNVVVFEEWPNEYKFSICLNSEETITYKIKVKKSNGIKDVVFNSIYEHEFEPDANILSIVGGDYNLENFPTENEESLINILESNGIEVLFANNKFTDNRYNSSYILNSRVTIDYTYDTVHYYGGGLICNDYTASYSSNSRYRYHSASTDWRLKHILDLFFNQRNPLYHMLGEIIIKTSLPEVWRKNKSDDALNKRFRI